MVRWHVRVKVCASAARDARVTRPRDGEVKDEGVVDQNEVRAVDSVRGQPPIETEAGVGLV